MHLKIKKPFFTCFTSFTVYADRCSCPPANLLLLQTVYTKVPALA